MIRDFTADDWKKIELYMKAGASAKRIAESFAVDLKFFEEEIKKRYGEEIYKIHSKFDVTGQLLIEAAQFQKALSGNVQMLMWLGKIRCGQKEPDSVSAIPPGQEEIDKDHIIMELNHKLSLLESNAN